MAKRKPKKFKLVDFDTTVTICERCGREYLDGTLVLKSLDGLRHHYGSDCAAKLLNTKNSSQLKKNAKSLARRARFEERVAKGEARRHKLSKRASVVVEKKRLSPRTVQELGLRQLSPKDVGKVGRTGVDNIEAVFNEATPEEKHFWGSWYDNVQSDIRQLADEKNLPYDVTAAVVATLSPSNLWLQNLRNAEIVIDAYFDDIPASDVFVHNSTRDIEKCYRILKTGEAKVTGKKVTNFYESLVNPAGARDKRTAVLDGHAINIWFGKKVPLSRVPNLSDDKKDKLEHDYVQASDELHTTPQQVQATTWYVWKYMPVGTEVVKAPRGRRKKVVTPVASPEAFLPKEPPSET